MTMHITIILMVLCLFFQTACSSITVPVQSTAPVRGDYSSMRKEISHLIKKKIKVTPEAVYRVGSITKLFTVMAAMQLSCNNIQIIRH